MLVCVCLCVKLAEHDIKCNTATLRKSASKTSSDGSLVIQIAINSIGATDWAQRVSAIDSGSVSTGTDCDVYITDHPSSVQHLAPRDSISYENR